MGRKWNAVARTARGGTPVVAIAVLALVATVAPVGAATAPTPRPERWSQKMSANHPDVGNELSGVSCPSTAQCDAVGSWRHSIPHQPPPGGGTLAESFRTHQWSITASPAQTVGSVLGSVSCPTVSRCYAVGRTSSGPLILSSTNGAWSTMTTPSLTGVALDAISCATASRCIAVGSISPHANSEPFAISLSGGTWSAMTVPTGGGDGNHLYDISCPSATQCLAVGYRNDNDPSRPVALQLSGAVWTRLTPPSRNTATTFQGVSCTSATRCVVVGASDTNLPLRRTLVERWSAGAWTIMESPNTPGQFSQLWDVDCTDFSHCIAVGGGGNDLPLIEKLGGSAWTMMTAPPIGSDATLFGVDCPGSSACFAVGQINQNGGNHAQSFIIRSQ